MEDYIKTLISHGYEQNKNFFKCRFIKNRRGDECDFVGTLSDTHIHFSTHTKVYLFECEGCTKRVVDFMELVEHRAPSTGIVCRGTVENMRQLRQDRMKTIEAHRCRNIFIVGATRDEFDEYLKYKKANEKHQSYGTPLYGEEEQQTRHQPQHRRASTPLVRTTPTPPSTLAPRDLRALPLDFPIPANFSQPPPVIPPGYFFNAPTGSQEHHQHYAPQPQENARPITPHGYPMPQNHHQNGGGWNPCANPPSARNAPATVKDNRSSSRPRRDRSQPRSYQPPVDPVQDRSRNGRATPMGTRGAPSPASSQNGNLFRNGTGSQHRGSPTDFKSKAPAKPPAQNGNASHNEHRSRSRSRATVPRSAQYRSEHQTEHARTGSSSHHESRSRAAAAAPVGASSQSKPPAPSPTSRETDSIPEAPAEPIRNISPPQPRWTRSQSRGRSEATRRSPPKGPSAPPAYTLPFGGSTPNHEPMDLEDPVPPPRPDRPRASTPLNTPVSQITRDEVATGVFHIRPQPVQDAVRMARTTIGYAGTRNRSPLREADAEQIAQVEAIKNRFAVQSRGTAKARSNSNRGAALLIETPEERQKKKDDASLEIMRKIKEKGRRLEQEKMGDSIAPNAAGTPPPTPPSVAAMLEPKEELDEDEPSTSTNVPVLRRVNSPPAQSTSYARRNDGKRHPSKSRSSRDDRDHRRDRDYDRRRGDDRRRDNHSHPYRRH
ncbi:C2H2-type domain-containing protein [Caenorhabditis elegans]|uniref:C2H2-type domain-containing protein n=2 Tax=Caenorhabditis elegans TaxID=6239 RepID=Q95XA7_CAEEL|nr:C2H2-type domain-containing protein [Caenorhabditis elegans]CCD73418.2 C2H2-type domain-containing protein [Caenorhabditis elegans]|eukprot:NP_490918.3 Uncharacterized protein CELE_Y20F4.4 [Caenorhabditis elegans]